MAKAARGGGAAPKKKDTGYAFKFSDPRSEPVARSGKPRMRVKYEQEVVPALKEQFSYDNPFVVPQLTNIVCNIGLGEAIKQPKLLEQAFESLGNITGQRPVVTLSLIHI